MFFIDLAYAAKRVYFITIINYLLNYYFFHFRKAWVRGLLSVGLRWLWRDSFVSSLELFGLHLGLAVQDYQRPEPHLAIPTTYHFNHTAALCTMW